MDSSLQSGDKPIPGTVEDPIAHESARGAGHVQNLTEPKPLNKSRTSDLIAANLMLQNEINERQCVEHSLRLSEERFDLAVRGTSEGIWDWNIETGHTHWSARFKELLGYRDDEIEATRSSFESLLHPDDRSRTLGALQRHHDDDVPYDTEYRLRNKHGEYLWFHARGQAIRDAEGRAVRMAGSIRDITEQKMAELALEASEEKYRSLAVASKDWIWEMDCAWNLTDTNHGLETVLGYTLDEFNRLDFLDLFHPETRAEVKSILPGLLERKQGWSNWIVRVLHKDGTYRMLESSALPMLDEQGELIGYRGADRDITDRVRVETALLESEERLELATEGTSDGIWDWNVRTNEQFWSPRFYQLLGYENGEVEATFQQFQGMLHPDDGARAQEAIRRHFEHDHPYDIEFRLKRKEGDYGWFHSRGKVIRDSEGTPMRMAGSLRDINERKRTEAALRDSEQRLREMVEHMPVLMEAFDAEENITVWNKECERVTGYTASEMIGNPEAMHLLYPDRDYLESMLALRIEKGVVYRDWEWTITCKNGQEKIISWSNISADHPIPTWRSWGIGVDISDRKHAESREIGLSRILEDSLNEIYVFNAETLNFIRVNRGARENLGYSMQELTTLTPLNLKPEITRAAFDEMIEPLRRGDLNMVKFTTKHRRKDGSLYDAEVNLQLARLGDQSVFIAIILDITERTLAEERRRLLVSELDHRVKNNLASVLSLVDQTIGLASDLEGFRSSFTGRIKAMAVAHEMLAQQHWHGAEIGKLIENVIEPHRRTESDRFRLDGDPVMIGPQVAPSITMVINELLTNAAKYGALSVPEGIVSIAWSIEKNIPDGPDMLLLCWKETGGPTVRRPAHIGFGTKLIDQLVKFQHKGVVDIRYESKGIRCELRIPLLKAEPLIDGLARS